MKHLTVLFAITLLVAACTPATSPNLDDPVTSTEGVNPPFAPNSGDAKFTRGNVFINKTGLVIRESYSPQIALTLSGDLPTPCHQLRAAVSKPDAENRILVDAYSVVDPNKMCSQVLKSFDENIELGTFPAGHYAVWVNGDLVGEFDS